MLQSHIDIPWMYHTLFMTNKHYFNTRLRQRLWGINERIFNEIKTIHKPGKIRINHAKLGPSILEILYIDLLAVSIWNGPPCRRMHDSPKYLDELYRHWQKTATSMFQTHYYPIAIGGREARPNRTQRNQRFLNTAPLGRCRSRWPRLYVLPHTASATVPAHTVTKG